MYIDKDSLIIEGVNMGTYVTEVKFGYHKLWDSDSGRNMAKETTGSFDIFPKITTSFKKLNQEEMEIISPILNKDTQNVTYYDPDLKEKTTMKTYVGDWEFVQKCLELAEPFSAAFISRKRRVQ